MKKYLLTLKSVGLDQTIEESYDVGSISHRELKRKAKELSQELMNKYNILEKIEEKLKNNKYDLEKDKNLFIMFFNCKVIE